MPTRHSFSTDPRVKIAVRLGGMISGSEPILILSFLKANDFVSELLEK